jgi:hypothetical protein
VAGVFAKAFSTEETVVPKSDIGFLPQSFFNRAKYVHNELTYQRLAATDNFIIEKVFNYS